MKILYIPQIVLVSLALSACGGSSSGGSGGRDNGQAPPAEDSTGNDSDSSGDNSGSDDTDSNSGSSDDNSSSNNNSGSSDNTDPGNTDSNSDGSDDNSSSDDNPSSNDNSGSSDNTDPGNTDSNSDGSDDNSSSDNNSGSSDNTDSGDTNPGSSDDDQGSDDSNDDSSTDNPSLACMPEWGQQMLDSLNQYRSQTRQCGDDTMPAVDPLSWQCQLTTSSQVHADDMADNNFFSHTGSNGLSMRNRIDAAGYLWSGIGENIAAGYANVSSVMDGWMSSPGHCRNIMSATYTEIGAALVKTSTADYPTYWVQNFGRPR